MELSFEQKSAIEAPEKQVLVVSGAGAGKAQPNWTKIPLPEGGWTTIGEIKKGDYVLNRFGRPVKVLDVFPQGKINCYKVTLSDGRVTYCNDQHIWTCIRDGKFENFTLREIMDFEEINGINSKTVYHPFQIPLCKELDFGYRPVSIEPYTLGTMFGQYFLKKCDFLNREQLFLFYLAHIERTKHLLRIDKDIKFDLGKFSKSDFENFCIKAQSIIYSETIPDDYIFNKVDVRNELVKGLMDELGDVNIYNKQVHIVKVSEKFQPSIERLFASLGISIKKTNYSNNSYVIRVPNKEKFYLFKYSHKEELNEISRAKDYPVLENALGRVSIETIEKTFPEEMTCIYVDDAEHLYLTNDFIVTHNTTVLTERAKRLLNSGVVPNTLVLITYTNNAAQEMKDRLSDCPGFEEVQIGTIHALAAKILSISGVKITGILERAAQNGDFDVLFQEIYRQPKIVVPHISHLLVDEFQDVAPQEFDFIKDILQPDNLFCVGDARQMIYTFKGSSRAVFDGLYNDPKTAVYELTENYRSLPQILRAAQLEIKDLPEASLTEVMPMREGKAQLARIPFDVDEVIEIIKASGSYKDWFVLARTNKLIDELKVVFEEKGLPYVNFRQAEKTTEEIKQLMEEDKVKLLTVHSAKGLEAKNVAFFENYLGNAKWSQEERDEEKRIRYVAITRARDNLLLIKQRRRPTRPYYNTGFGW